MGLGRLLTRNLQYVATNTNTGQSQTFTIVTDGGPGMYADWSRGEYRGGMAIPAAWRASLLLSNLIGQVPWHAYRERAGRPAEMLEPTPLLLEQPAPPETRMSTLSSMALDLLWHGNAIAVVTSRSATGWANGITPVSAEFVQVDRIGPGTPDPMFPVGEVVYIIGGRRFSWRDIVHVKGPCKPGDLRGMGVLENHFASLDLSRELYRAAGDVGSSGVPTGVLKSLNPDLTQPDADALKAAWTNAQRTRSVAVLNLSTEYTPLAWSPTETQLIEARQFALTDWANIFGVPGNFVGAENSSRVYSNVEQEGINLVKWSLQSHLTRFEQALSAHLPRGTWAKANLDSILRGDTKARYEAHALAIQNGFLTDDEVRALEDRPPLTPAQRAAMAPPAPVAGAPSSTSNDTPTEEEA